MLQDMPPLPNARHERFAQEFLTDLNSTAAYGRAYPETTARSARAAGARLLANVSVQARVAELQAERAARVQVTQDDVLRELVVIGFSDMRRFATWGATGVTLRNSDELEGDDARCVEEVSETKSKEGGSLKCKLHAKVPALVRVGEHLGMFPRRHEHTGKDGGPIEYQDMTPEQRAARVKELLELGAHRANGNGRANKAGRR